LALVLEREGGASEEKLPQDGGVEIRLASSRARSRVLGEVLSSWW
jgi:hypothetical protein